MTRTWPGLLGVLPLTAQRVVDDLSHHTGTPAVDAQAEAMRQALLTLTGAAAWPPDVAAVEAVLAALPGLAGEAGGWVVGGKGPG